MDLVHYWFPGHGRVPYVLPVVPAPARARLQDVRSRGIRVLLVEDDPSIAEMYRVQLEHDGFVVTVATTGELAFSSLAEREPDLVLLDLLLPDRSGFDVLVTLNE